MPVASPSLGLPEDEYGHALFNSLDNFSRLRGALNQIAAKENSWAGIPMPITGHRLVIEPKFPRAALIEEIGVTQEMRDQDEATEARLKAKFGNCTVRSRFWSMHRKAEVVTFNDDDGKVRHGINQGINRAGMALNILDVSSAWGLDQEHRATQLLGTLVRHRIFKAYLLTGVLLETSKRSGLTYLFRRLRPTLVVDPKHPDGQLRLRCALCMHPIGYYEGTWAGAMTPTDEVVAALMLMRGDEPMLWRRANQIPIWRPEAGL